MKLRPKQAHGFAHEILCLVHKALNIDSPLTPIERLIESNRKTSHSNQGNPTLKAKILRLRKRGLSIYAIGEAVGLNPSTVKYHLESLGQWEDLRQVKWSKARRLRMSSLSGKSKIWKLTDEQRTQIVEKYIAGGTTQYKLALEYGVTKQAVSQIIQKRKRK